MEEKRQQEPLYGRWRCCSGGGCSTLNWNTPSRAQPYPSRMGGKSKRDELYIVCATLPTSSRAVCQFRLSTGQCNASGLSKRNHEEMNVKNYIVDRTHFLHFFFLTHDVLHTRRHEGAPLYRGGGVLYENEDWSATHKRWMMHKTPFPHPTHIASRMSCIQWLSHKVPWQKQTTLYKLYKPLFKTVQK